MNHIIPQVARFSLSMTDELPGLEQGWIGQTKMDLYDYQWRSFRASLPLLLSFAIIVIAFVRIARNQSYQTLVGTNIVVGILFLYALHGYWTIYIYMIIYMNYEVCRLAARNLSRNKGSVIIWCFNLCMMVYVPLYGSRLYVPKFLQPFGYEGMQGWTSMFHMLILKFISFGMDYVWAVHSAPDQSMTEHHLDYKTRQNTNQPMDRYTFSNFLAYSTYVPLFIGGPIISFNAFVSQLDIPQTTYSSRGLIFYGIFRLALIFLIMDVFLHFWYPNALTASQSESILSQIQPCSLAFGVSLLTLLFMWLKFLLIWRTSRFWSLLCGIETPENMNRCVLNNYSMIQFWRDWHSSFNIWLLRYIYIPLGGSKSVSRRSKYFNVFVVFFFVAVWHDPEWRYIHWAWIVLLAIVPESLCRTIFYETKFGSKIRKYRFFSNFLVIFGGTLNVFLMMSANLVGYVYGLNGLSILTQTLTSSPLIDIFMTFGGLYMGVAVMYMIEQNREKNI